MQQSNRPLLIGITGSIGSGKTTVCKLIEKKYTVIYADDIAHQILQQSDVINNLVARWGHVILNHNQLDRKVIAEKVFGNQPELEYLNNLVHPEVLRAMQDIVNNSKGKVLFFEVPLLFEANLQTCFDYIIMVRTSLETMFNRVAKRDNLSNDDVRKRLAEQMDDNIKAQTSDYIIDNESSINDLEIQVNMQLEKWVNIPYRVTDPFDKFIL